MGTSTDAIVCFGVRLGEDEILPWQDYDEIDDWWADMNGFMYDSGGENIYSQQREFLKENPLPVELVWHCSDNSPMYILAVPGTAITAHRGYPRILNPTEMTAKITSKSIAAFVAFIAEHGLNTEDNSPEWYLASYLR